MSLKRWAGESWPLRCWPFRRRCSRAQLLLLLLPLHDSCRCWLPLTRCSRCRQRIATASTSASVRGTAQQSGLHRQPPSAEAVWLCSVVAVLSAPARSDIDAWEQRPIAAPDSSTSLPAPAQLQLPPLPPLLSLTSALAAGVVQSPACTAHLLSSLLSLLLSLLRVDAIVQVGRIRPDVSAPELDREEEEDS